MQQNEDKQLSENDLEVVSGGDTGTNVGIGLAAGATGLGLGAVTTKLFQRLGSKPAHASPEAAAHEAERIPASLIPR